MGSEEYKSSFPLLQLLNVGQMFNNAIKDVGGTYDDETGRWDLGAVDLTGPLKRVATEEVNAISKHGPTSGFDAAKALTNILRMIKGRNR